MRATLRLVGVLVLAAACGEGPGVAVDAATRARAAAADSVVLERLGCYWECPMYRLSVSSSGRVHFESRVRGGEGRVASDSIAPASAARLLAGAADAGVFALPDSVRADSRLCALEATDHEWLAVGVFGPAGASKRVVDYDGCFVGDVDAPRVPAALEALRAYEAAIDSAAGSARWVRAGGRS